MVRGPCCEKMGLKKGPWSPKEDQILVGYIQRYGHGNWRALPKQAGLLRCGKSCRLRWTNYLRPDVKRGNFSKEEEETIITLHQMLGNRWSMIAARLPGRTDNEIKNVWHTHLKKQLKPDQRVEASNRKAQYTAKTEMGSEPATVRMNSTRGHRGFQNPGLTPDSPARSYSDISYSGTDSSIVTGENHSACRVKEERIDSREELPEIDASFWSEALSMENNCTAPAMEFTTSPSPIRKPFGASCSSNIDDDMSFWLRTFMEAGDLQDLPEI